MSRQIFCLEENLQFCNLDGDLITPTNTRLMRIINGVKPVENSWSWLVKLEFQDFTSYNRGNIPGGLPCGGNILNSDWVLTAGHCCDGKYLVRINFKEKLMKLWKTRTGKKKEIF